MSSTDFVHAWVVETGERVYIPKAHLEIFEGVFTLEDPQGAAAVKAKNVKPSPVGDTK